MTKKKKGKVIQLPLTPEKYIRTRVRQLPVYECYINEQWKESGMANIIVARKHTNNNLTFGLYLVDLLCLGVKDTYYDFNVTNVDYEDLKNEYFGKQDIVKCDYVLAHNIIYGAVEFADEYGFKPHKDFAVSKYILEEDDENVELMEIEFGEDEKPCVVVTTGNEQKQIIAQLDKTAGKGNYTVVYLDDEDLKDDFEGEVDEDDLNDWTDEDWKEFSDGKRETAYEGLNPHDFFQIILNTLGEGSPVILQSSIANIDLDRSPLFRLVEVYLGEIIKYQPLKLTINGNLPRNLCRELYEMKIIKDDYQEVGVPKIVSEKDFMYLHNIRLLCDMAGLTKKRHNRISLTKKGENLMDNSNRTQLFHLLFKTYAMDFSWAYNDLYEDDGTLQSGFGYTLYLVKKFGKTEKEASFYSEKYLKAFPFLIDPFDEGICYKKEDYFRDCYILRTFLRFLEPFGFVEIRREGTNIFKDKDYIKKTKLFDKVFSFSVNSSDDCSRLTS